MTGVYQHHFSTCGGLRDALNVRKTDAKPFKLFNHGVSGNTMNQNWEV